MENKLTDDRTMPAAFIGHGSPMNTLEHNRYTDAWRAFGDSVPTPRAVLVISAHWYTNATAVTAMARPAGHPRLLRVPRRAVRLRLSRARPSRGRRARRREVEPRWVGLDVDSWGLDHGTWSVLAHMFPDADVPVVQLSINALQPLDYHLDLGARLAPLRDQGVLIVGSGNVVHNLRRIDWDQPDRRVRLEPPLRRRRHLAHARPPRRHPRSSPTTTTSTWPCPTPDHFIPLLYIAALAAAAGDTARRARRRTRLRVAVDDQLHARRRLPDADRRTGAAQLPLPAAAPPDQANI